MSNQCSCFHNQSPYFNRSAMCLRKDFSLHRAYIIFRSLGLRHLTITGKDLRGFLRVLGELQGFGERTIGKGKYTKKRPKVYSFMQAKISLKVVLCFIY